MAIKEYDLDQPLDTLLDIAGKKFGGVHFEPVTVGDVTLEVLQITDMQRYIDKLVGKTRSGDSVSLPLWAKIWASSLILGYTLTKFPMRDGARILEIGAGGAVNGLVLAGRGFDVTVTDMAPDALLFSKINVLKNGLNEKVAVSRTDFTCEKLTCKYDYIVGCEVLYDEVVFAPLVEFLDCHISEESHAEILLALDEKRQARQFFELANEKFAMMKSGAKFKDDKTGDENAVNLFRLRRK